MITVSNVPNTQPFDTLHIQKYHRDDPSARAAHIVDIVLNPSRWHILKQQMLRIISLLNNPVAEFKRHLGGKIYVVKNGLERSVHLRKFIKTDMSHGNWDEPVPSRKGIILGYGEFMKLVEATYIIEDLSEEFKHASPCYDEPFHKEYNGTGYYACKECAPYYTGDLIA